MGQLENSGVRVGRPAGMGTRLSLSRPGDATAAAPSFFARTIAHVRSAAWLRRLAGNRLVQFAAIGGVVFALAPAPSPREVISLRRQSLRTLLVADVARGERVTGRRAAEIEQRALEDEVFYREGVRLGFDKDDGIVRQRVIQKVLFLAEELGGASRAPKEAELRAFFTANGDRFARPPRIRFRHVFERDRASGLRLAHTQLAAGGASRGGSPRGGRPSPIGPEMDADLPHIERTLGAAFARAVADLAPGTWSAPIQSAFGWHSVYVIASAPGRPARFEEARPSVLEQFSVHRRQAAIAHYLSRAFAKYRVDIDGRPVKVLAASPRLALRGVPSGED